MVVVLGIFIISIQVSSLISSLVLVPISVVIMIFLNMNLVYSGFLCYIFIMIFIGGLMVLLVSVTSMVFQEQGIFPSTVLVGLGGLCLTIMIFSYMDWSKGSDFSETHLGLISFMDMNMTSVVVSILVILILCLFILTKLLLDYKGMTRML